MATKLNIKPGRRVNKSNRIAICMVAGVLLVIFGAMALMARNTAAGLSLGVELKSEAKRS